MEKLINFGYSLVVRCLGICPSTTEGKDLIPGWGTKVLQAIWCGQKKKKINEF